MPISSTENRKVYTGNGVATVFSFPYYFLKNEDLVVLKTEIATGSVSTLALTTDYSVTGAGDANGGSVTITPAVSSAYKITIYRDPEVTQETDFVNNGSLPADELERPVDKLTMIAQRLKELLTRSLRLADGDTSSASMILPTPVATKGLRWNDAGTALENYSITVPTGAVVSASVGVEGISPRASQAQVNTGTDPAAHVTPETLAASDLAARVATAEVDVDSLQSFNVSDNLLINGGFQVNHRVVTTGAADDTYTLDRWNLLTQTSTVTIAQQLLQESGTTYNIRITQAQATAQRIGLEQIVQAGNCVFMRGRNIVLGARVRSSAAQTIRYAILEWTGTANAVTSDVVNDWTSGSYTAGNFFLASNLTIAAVGSQAIAANTWTDLAGITATISASMNNLIAVFWSESAMAQNETLDIARAQLVAGTTLPEFKNEDFSVTAMRCSKYFFSTFELDQKPIENCGDIPYGQGTGAQTVAASTASPAGIKINYPYDGLWTPSPTITTYNPFAAGSAVRNTTRATSCTATTVANSSKEGCRVTFTTPAGSALGDVLAIHLTADAEL